MLSTPTAPTDAPSIPGHRRYYLGKMAAAISRFSRYYDEVVQVARGKHDHDNILSLIDCPNKRLVEDIASIPDVSEHPEHRLIVLLKGNTNHSTRLTILDADLTMPPEDLPLYYDAYVAGKADFVNGSRLLYKMDDDAMRFLNKLGNVFFAKELSWILGTRFTDTLCGTKLLPSDTYRRFVSWRDDFGDFDPFGDFELLFPAAVLKIGSIDIPVCYRDRQYGETQISRFRHGWMLLRMTTIAFFRIRLGG